MNEKDIPPDEFTPAPGVILSLSQLTREQFLELMSSDHPAAKDFKRYHKKEFEYRNKSYRALNDFYRDRFLKE
jgi:16S rRNA A1518/A1519 N6-dimethyltransferase RsmA/KsgA/DIM1 with predicted DNA glycosylase/AP lyase activity